MYTTHKTCPTGWDAVVYILPIFTLQYMMGVLVQLKHTALLRIALPPLILWVILRALSVLDFSCGQQDHIIVLFVSCVLPAYRTKGIQALSSPGKHSVDSCTHNCMDSGTSTIQTRQRHCC